MMSHFRCERITGALQLRCVRAPRGGVARYAPRMCRSIRNLRHEDDPATTGEVEAAARQFVRKVTGFQKPSQRNAEAFEAAIAEIALVSQRLIVAVGGDVEPGPDRKPPARVYTDRDRERWAERDRARAEAHEHAHPHSAGVA
jgi:hypothetical protein